MTVAARLATTGRGVDVKVDEAVGVRVSVGEGIGVEVDAGEGEASMVAGAFGVAGGGNPAGVQEIKTQTRQIPGMTYLNLFPIQCSVNVLLKISIRQGARDQFSINNE